MTSSTQAMARIEVRTAETRRDRDSFLRLPWRIYRDDPNWVPPLLVQQKHFLDSRRHPFYLHGSAMPLIAERDGQIVGRILVSDDSRYNAEHSSNVGCFGMLESVNDSEVARALVDAAAAWLRDRGRAEMLGPIDYSTNYPCGLLIDGFDTPPRIMMNHHRPYYAELLEASGLKKAKDLYAWWFEDPDDMLAKWRCRAERLTARGNIKIRPFDRRDFAADVERCKRIYHAAWERNWGFVRMTDEEFTAMAEELRRFAIPELLLLAEVDGNAVGCAVTLPDLNEATCHLNGRLTTFGLPIGLFKLMWRMRKIKTARMLIFGVLEDYRRRGVAELLILRSLDCGKNTLGFTGAELGWTLEDNHLINRTIEAVGARRYKTYRIYGKSIC